VGFKNWKVVALPKALQNKDLGKLQILTTQTLCKHQVTNLAMQCTNYRLPINRLFIYLIEIDSYELLPQETRREKRNFPSAARKRGRCFVQGRYSLFNFKKHLFHRHFGIPWYSYITVKISLL
jgi:hypothetical protein